MLLANWNGRPTQSISTETSQVLRRLWQIIRFESGNFFFKISSIFIPLFWTHFQVKISQFSFKLETRIRLYFIQYFVELKFLKWQSGEQISGWFILYRVLLALLFICILLSSILTEDWNLWWIFLTDWSFIGLTIHFIISAAVVIEQLLNEYHGDISNDKIVTNSRINHFF